MEILNELKITAIDFLIIGIPCFGLGCFSTLIFLMNEKFKSDDRREGIREKRIDYIYYLIGVVKKKRRQEQKIDVD